MTNAAASRLLTNLREKVANEVLPYMYPDEDASSNDFDKDDSDDAVDVDGGETDTDESTDEDSDSVDRALDDDDEEF